ncbi:nicotinate-nucleotide adenylyltransferase [Alteribacillus iranensis]|uniref:Probable nicotinate-nucleotide adenylyltransferase n=1 Tax=Alteribacillus iranensis TaxID=930128 RepID=A0A1I1Z9A6_9BACI|nr:nicotinate-nucleotide adenylyltransferase [Alteribacillus iranensis]SFE28341.1 nicotinate-nucleotide adenylyltransferase [Alteribacillus iranensis]
MTEKIGLMGGTFDPPHVAHLLIAQETLSSLGLDEIWFIPANIPPHKTRNHLTTSEDRLQMTQRAVNSNTKFHVCDIEFDRSGPSYTIDTVKELKRRHPADYYFIIGGDMAEQLHTWKDISTLNTLVTFVVAERPGYYAGKCEIEGIEHIKVPQLDISSTLIRERCRKGENIRYFVPEDVRDWIRERELYGYRPKNST